MDWRTITVDGRDDTLLVSIVNEKNDNFRFNLTDLKTLWREKLTWKEILQRAQNENPIMCVDSDESAIEQTIFSPAKNYQFTSNETDAVLKSKYYIAGVPFHFKWKLTKCDADEFYEQITRKLLVTLLNVQDQRTELLDIVKRKDAEISQYRVEGAVLSRVQMATQPFLKSEFDGKFELMSELSLFVGGDNERTIRAMCKYSDEIKASSAIPLDVPQKPSPSKMSKLQKNKEDNAMRKFKTKKEHKITYESSCELLISDEEMPKDEGKNMESNKGNQTDNGATETKPIRKRKLNL